MPLNLSCGLAFAHALILVASVLYHPLDRLCCHFSLNFETRFAMCLPLGRKSFPECGRITVDFSPFRRPWALFIEDVWRIRPGNQVFFLCISPNWCSLLHYIFILGKELAFLEVTGFAASSEVSGLVEGRLTWFIASSTHSTLRASVAQYFGLFRSHVHT